VSTPSRPAAWLLLALSIPSGATCGSDPAPERPGNRDTISLAELDTTSADTGAGIVQPAGTPVSAETSAMLPWTAGIVDIPTDGGISTLVSVRAARHEEFDRVVWELLGEMPGVHVEYVDEPVRSCGSGEPVALSGDAWLEVRITPVSAHTEAGQPTIAERMRATDLPVVLEIVQTCDYEAVVTWVLAVRSPESYRLGRFGDPSRVVVDVRHPR
jgi:hypothetical protein